jgi:hypothetical protein
MWISKGSRAKSFVAIIYTYALLMHNDLKISTPFIEMDSKN